MLVLITGKNSLVLNCPFVHVCMFVCTWVYGIHIVPVINQVTLIFLTPNTRPETKHYIRTCLCNCPVVRSVKENNCSNCERAGTRRRIADVCLGAPSLTTVHVTNDRLIAIISCNRNVENLLNLIPVMLNSFYLMVNKGE